MMLECCLGLLLLMSHTEKSRYKIETECQRRRVVGQNIMFTDLKRAQRAPRLSHTRFEELVMLHITYTLFLKMHFGPRNKHLTGVNAMRCQLMAMTLFKDHFDKYYFASIVWTIFDDYVVHFNQVMPKSAFTSGRATVDVAWSTLRLTSLPAASVSTPTSQWSLSCGSGASH